MSIKRIKYSEVIIGNEAKALHDENYKTLLRKIKENEDQSTYLVFMD